MTEDAVDRKINLIIEMLLMTSSRSKILTQDDIYEYTKRFQEIIENDTN